MTVPATPFTTVEDGLQSWVATASGIPGTSVIWAQQADKRPANPWISLLMTDVQRDGLGWVDVEPNPLVFADTPFTADPTTDRLLAVAHGRSTGDGPVRFETGGTLPAPLQPATDYWLVKVDADHLKVAATFAQAIDASPTTIDITIAGTGAHTLVDTADTVAAGKEILHVVRANYSATLVIQCYADPPTGEDGAADPPADRPLSPVAVLQAVAAASMLPSVRAALEEAGVGVYDFGAIRAIGEVIESAVFEPRAILEAKVWMVAEVSEPGSIITSVEITNQIEGLPDDVFEVP